MKKIILLLVVFCAAKNIIAQNVGIGTTTPNDKLTVVNAQPGYGITHTYGSVTMGTYISNLYGQFGTKTNHPLQFFTNNGNAQLTLLQNGNFGIGTGLPTEKLNIDGTVLTEGILAGFRFNSRGDNTKGFQWYSIGGNAYLYRYHAQAGNALSVLANGNIGLNIDVPQSDLHVNPNGAGSILIGTNKSAGGYTNLEMGITAQSGGASYIQSTLSSGSAYGNLYLNPGGSYVGVNLPTSTSLFAPLDVNQSSSFRGIRIRNTVTPLGTQTWDVYVNNQLHFAIAGPFGGEVAYIGDDGTYNQVSDARFKTGITKMESVLNKVMALQPKKYKYNFNNPQNKVSSGFIAQEVMQVFPEFVSDFHRPSNDSTDNEVYHGINYAGFSVIAIKAIQEQQIQIDTLNKKYNKMIELIENMKIEMEALKQNKKLK
jgi:hypothetical protein